MAGRSRNAGFYQHHSGSVCLNIYDLVPYNAYTYFCGIGVFHAGVEVYGVEYAYGGHDHDCSGVFATKPRDAPGQVVFRETIYMGDTDLTQEEVHALVQSMGAEYKGNKYHLLQRNCNHFATDLCRHLVGKPAPFWINRLAGLAVALHCLLPASFVPPLMPPSVEPSFEERQNLLIGGVTNRSSGYSAAAPVHQTFSSLSGEVRA